MIPRGDCLSAKCIYLTKWFVIYLKVTIEALISIVLYAYLLPIKLF